MIAQQWAWNQKEFPSQVAGAERNSSCTPSLICSYLIETHCWCFDSTCGSCFQVSWVVSDCGVFSRFELEAVEDVEAWSPWRLIRVFFWVNYCQLFFLLGKFQDNQFQPRVQRYSQNISRALFVGLSTQSAADSLVIRLSVIKKRFFYPSKSCEPKHHWGRLCKVQKWMRHHSFHTSQLMLHDAPVAWHGHCQQTLSHMFQW